MSFLRAFGVTGARGLRTERAFAAGEVICDIPCTASRGAPSRATVQVDRTTHVEVGVLSTMNHSCDPNAILDTSRMLVVAARDVAAGEELTYFYPSTEWDLAEPFACRCGSPRCLGVVRGARHIPWKSLGRTFVNSHIQAMKRAAG